MIANFRGAREHFAVGNDVEDRLAELRFAARTKWGDGGANLAKASLLFVRDEGVG